MQWAPVVQALKLNPSDFDERGHKDYPLSEYQEGQSIKRGGQDYFLPVTWSRLGLNVKDKYKGDENWLGDKEEQNPWNVAFHGTTSFAAKSIASQGLRTDHIKRDVMRKEAVKLRGAKFDRPGLYVATKCEGGASMYATEFDVPIGSNQTEKYQLVFQCRVKPGEYTVHKGSLNDGHMWRFVDPAHIRPYGILLKKKT